MGKLGPYLAVIKFFMRFGVWFCGLGWEVVIPCENMIQCRSAKLAFPRVLLLFIEVSSSAIKEVLQFVVRHS